MPRRLIWVVTWCGRLQWEDSSDMTNVYHLTILLSIILPSIILLSYHLTISPFTILPSTILLSYLSTILPFYHLPPTILPSISQNWDDWFGWISSTFLNVHSQSAWTLKISRRGHFDRAVGCLRKLIELAEITLQLRDRHTGTSWDGERVHRHCQCCWGGCQTKEKITEILNHSPPR